MSAFLDEDFRSFDFHRGMVDAWHFVSKESDTRILFEELAHANPESPPTTVGVDSPLFECFLAFEQSVADEPTALPACGRLRTEESQNVLSLMAVSRKMRKDPTLSLSNNFERFTEGLATRGYVFRSGLLKGQTASALQGKFRQVFGDAVTELTHQQPRSQQLGFQVGTKLALDSAIAYQPVPFYSLVGITSGGLELAVSPSLMPCGRGSIWTGAVRARRCMCPPPRAPMRPRSSRRWGCCSERAGGSNPLWRAR